MFQVLICFFALFFTSIYATAEQQIDTAVKPLVTTINKKIDLQGDSWHKVPNLDRFIIQQDVNANEVVVHNILDVNLSEFFGEIKISNIEAYENISALWCHFFNTVEFSNALIHNSFDISGSYFSKMLDFEHIDVHGDLLLKLAKFIDVVNISHSNINVINISKSYFTKELKVLNTTFNNLFLSQHVLFKDNLVFNLVNFKKGLDLSNSHIKGNIIFKNVLMSGVLDLSYVKANRVDLSDVHIDVGDKRVEEKIKIDVSHSQIKNLIADFNDFELIFANDLVFEDKILIFDNLLKVTKESNNESSYRALFLQYNKFKHGYKNQEIWGDFLAIFWSYGLDRAKPFQWFGWFFLFFLCTNALFYPEISNKYLSISFLPESKDDIVDNSPITRLVYYFPYSIFLTIFLFLASFILSLRVMFPVEIKKEEFLGMSQSKRVIILSYFFLIILLGYAYILFIFAFLINQGV